jgi:putative heme-binding domain-containing protein
MRRRHGLIAHLCILLALGTPGALPAQDKSSARPEGESHGSALFASNCAACHGADGRGGEHAPDIATASDVQRLTDKNLIDIVNNGITGTGMPGFGELGHDQILALVRYLRTLQGKNTAVTLPGNAEHGEKLFFGKAQCSECHMAQGKGGFIAADLSYSDANTNVDHLRQVILDPVNSLPASKKAVTVTTTDGQKYIGALRAQDNFSISIQTLDGAFHYFLKSQLTSLNIGSNSLMPHDYRSRLSDAEINDLISYLIRIGSQSPKADDSSDDDDE